MKSLFILIVSFAFFAAGCKKTPLTPVIVVSDYVSGQPIAEAEIWKINRTDFDITCLCFWDITKTLIGTTDGIGQFTGDFSQPGEIEIRKTGYHYGNTLDNSVYEESNEKRVFRLFKRATIRITRNPSRYYNNPNLELRAILKDGTTANFRVTGYPLYYLNPDPVEIIGVGDVQNRIIVRDGTTALMQTDFFVPAYTTKEITLNY